MYIGGVNREKELDMGKRMPKAVMDRMESEQRPAVAEDKLDRIRDAASTLRSLVLNRDELEHQLETVSSQINNLKLEGIPAMLSGVGLTSLSIEASGNTPAFELKIKPFYKAGIPADWPDDKRQIGFEHLIERNAGDLIKTTVSFEFSRDSEPQVNSFLSMLEDLQFTTPDGQDFPQPTVKQTVHHATLSSWLKEEWTLSAKRGEPQPKLDLIGGVVGKIAEVKDK
jgi:hypothetical protein